MTQRGQSDHSKTSIVLVALRVCASSGRTAPKVFGDVNLHPIWTTTSIGKLVNSASSHSDRARSEMGASNSRGEFRFTPNQKPTVPLAASGPLEQKI